MDQEPSVLDFVKARLHYWRYKILHPKADVDEVRESDFWADREQEPAPGQDEAPQSPTETLPGFPWRVFLAVGLALFGQLSLEPHEGAREWRFGLFLFILACLALAWSYWRDEWSLPSWKTEDHADSQVTQFIRSSLFFVISLVFSLIAFVAFGGNRFNTFNLAVWFIAIFAMMRAFWQPGADSLAWIDGVRGFLSSRRWTFSVDRSTLPLLVVIALVLFFRVYRLADVPSQMISDHAEKLWDVGDVLNGQTSIFFSRNTGREFFQFYLTAVVSILFNTGLTYMSLKIGTVLTGLVALYYLYLLGREVGGSRVALVTLAFAGIAYWHNVISRYGLRFPLYPLFYAPVIYYLVRGLQRRRFNDFILCGLILGLGLHGYSPFRMAPIVVVVAIGLYLLHKQSGGYRLQTAWGLFAVIVFSLIVFLPLLRYMTENPDMVFYRAMTRIGDLERPLPGPVSQIFLQNLKNSLTMFSWDDGEVWPISVPHRPVLDVVTSVFFHLGVVLLIIRYIRQRNWLDIFTLVSIPMLMMPSILSLTFPGENPSLNRSAAAIVPVFLVVGIAFDSFLSALESASTRRYAWVVGTFLLMWASWQNYDLVFNQYRKLYDASSWNTTELGAVVRDFAELTGSSETVWLVGYPYWVDSRLVMINAGFPMRDNAIWPENFAGAVDDPRPKLFLININDTADMDALQSIYPAGKLMTYDSKYENKDFMLFFVPAR